MKFIIIVLPVIFADANDFNLPLLKSKIIGGEFAPPGTMTFMASIRDMEKEHYCGGSLISGTHVLTVAHCIARHREIRIPKYNGIYVVVGTHNISEEGIRRDIKYLDYYKNFNQNVEGEISGDIGLITFYKAVELIPDRVSYLKLPTYGTEIGTSGITPGWGHTVYSANKTSTKSQMLKYLGVQVADISYCRSRLLREVYDKVLCVYPRLKYTRLAKADSGSPLVFFDKVIGIQSATGNRRSAIIFTHVFEYLDYIKAAKRRAARNIDPHWAHTVPNDPVCGSNSTEESKRCGIDCFC